MTKVILYKTQLVLSFPILVLFAVIIVIFQPSFSYTQTEWSWNTLNDIGLTYAIVSNDEQQINLLLDDTIDEEKEAFGIFAIPKKQNNEITNIQYYPPPTIIRNLYWLSD